MHPSRPVGPALLLSLAVLAACSSPTDPTEGISLRVTPSDVNLGGPGQPPFAVEVHLVNAGPGSVSVRICNNGGVPGTEAVLEERNGSGTWVRVVPWVTCATPEDGFSLTVKQGTEARVLRAPPAPRTGTFRYTLTYSSRTGSSETVASNTFIVR